MSEKLLRDDEAEALRRRAVENGAGALTESELDALCRYYLETETAPAPRAFHADAQASADPERGRHRMLALEWHRLLWELENPSSESSERQEDADEEPPAVVPDEPRGDADNTSPQPTTRPVGKPTLHLAVADARPRGEGMVTALSIVTTGRVEIGINNRTTALEVTSVFAPEVTERGLQSGRSTCLAGVLHASSGALPLPSLDVDELCYVHLHGSAVFTFEGAEPVALDASGRVQILWLPGAAVQGRRGIPQALVTCRDGWAAGLVVLVRKAGVHWRGPFANDQIELGEVDAENWSADSATEYWSALGSLAPGLITRRQPFFTAVPIGEADLRGAFSGSKRLPDGEADLRRDPHRDAREARQIDYAFVPGWDPYALRRGTTAQPTSTRRPLFDFRLLRFDALSAAVRKDLVWLVQHPEGYEIVLPLIGEFRCVGAEVEPDEFSHEHGPYPFRAEDEGLASERIMEKIVLARAVPGRLLPDYVAICSDAVSHGFAAASEADAYALHVRVGRSSVPRSGGLVGHASRRNVAGGGNR